MPQVMNIPIILFWLIHIVHLYQTSHVPHKDIKYYVLIIIKIKKNKESKNKML